jgi:hypothetical protein
MKIWKIAKNIGEPIFYSLGNQGKNIKVAAIPQIQDIKKYINPRSHGFLQGPKSVHEELSKKNVNILNNMFPNMKYLGGGFEGVVYDIGDNRVIKLTPEPLEYKVSMFFLKNPESFYVRIFDVFVLENNGKLPIYAIIKEKIKDLPKEALSVAYWLYEGNKIPEMDKKIIGIWKRKWEGFNRIKKCSVSSSLHIDFMKNVGINDAEDIVMYDPS